MTVVGARKVFVEGLSIPIRIGVDGEGNAERDGGVKDVTLDNCGEREEAL